jgi:hypothetical protein
VGAAYQLSKELGQTAVACEGVYEENAPCILSMIRMVVGRSCSRENYRPDI